MLPKKCPKCHSRSLKADQAEFTCTNCDYHRPLKFYQRPIAWASGRAWWWRLPILAWFVVMLRQNLHNLSFALDRTKNPFSALDLGVHELGHILFSPLGEFMHILSGSLFQCLFPLLWMLGFMQKRWRFATAMCWCWLGLNLFDVATYAADARARVIPLSTGIAGLYEQGSDEVYDKAHDWYQILLRTHHLNSDLAIAHGLRIAAITAFIIGLTYGSILVLQMFISSVGKLVKPKQTAKK